MLFDIAPTQQDIELYKARRKDLSKRIQEMYSDKEGLTILFAGFEQERIPFKQESSFFYYTGISEPGAVVTVDFDGRTVLYIPNCGEARAKWMYSPIALTQENAKDLGVDTVTVLGDACSGYQFSPFFEKNTYGHLLSLIENLVKENKTIFTLCPDDQHQYIEQRLVLKHIESFVPKLTETIQDIAPIVSDMRSRKDRHEIECIYQAVQVTCDAQEAAAQAIKDGVYEAEVQASAEYIMTASNGFRAFPSIVATGKQATILHYAASKHILKTGELVVVDIGADINNYCADLTRTYPVSGTFTKRQKELYNLVLETQEYIANIAQPGYWLSNKEQQEKSLHHLALSFLKERGYDQYFIHGLGHYLGLDVHDVGDYRKPLEEGNVITIEPGIYIPEENIGIRIEDNYWIVKGGAVCLSEQLPKKPEAIEELVQRVFTEEDEEEELSKEVIDQFFSLDQKDTDVEA